MRDIPNKTAPKQIALFIKYENHKYDSINAI